MRILIYGAGVIGSHYATLLSKTSAEVSMLARGKRLSQLQSEGLLYDEGGKVSKATVQILDTLADDDCYDYILLAVRAEQLHSALAALKSNQSPTIVTMVNSIEPYAVWESLVGQGRILPAFPGAGGGFEGGVLYAKLTPRLIQPTTFGEISGEQTERVRTLKQVLQSARIPCQIVKDMHAWQVCHLAMVVPLADAYELTEGDARSVGLDKRIMMQTAKQLRENFRTLKRLGISISPPKMNVFRWLPLGLMRFVLGQVYRSRFGDLFMYRHAVKAKDEMHTLHADFERFCKAHAS